MATEVVKVPAERDLEVYRLVAVEGRSTHAVADLFRISQTRVCQLVERVLGWMAEVLPKAAEGLPEESRLQLAQQISIARLDYLYGEAVAAWKASQVGDSWSSQQRRTPTGGMVEVQTVRREQGNIRYLAAATHICLQMAKVPAAMLPLVCARHSPEVGFAASERAEAASPPDRDCSSFSDEQEHEEVGAVAMQEPTDVPADSYEPEPEMNSAFDEPALSVFTPVQTAEACVDLDSSARGKLRRPLNRKQRRAREKLLGRLRKAK